MKEKLPERYNMPFSFQYLKCETKFTKIPLMFACLIFYRITQSEWKSEKEKISVRKKASNRARDRETDAGREGKSEIHSEHVLKEIITMEMKT